MQLSANKGNINAAQQRSGASRRHQSVAAAAAGVSRTHTAAPQLASTTSSCVPSRDQAFSASPCRPSRRQSASRIVAAAAGSSDAEVYDTVVVGAGISGLVTAQALATNHGDRVKSFLVTEGRDRVGGNITSLQGDGYVWEEGPNSFQPNDSMLQAAVSNLVS